MKDILSKQKVQRNCPSCGSEKHARERQLKSFELVRCSNCSMVFVSPSLSDEALDALYVDKDVDSLIDLYSRINTPSIIANYNCRLDALEQLLPNRGRMLDFACAAGHFFEEAAKRGWEAHGSDLGQWTREAADRRGLKNLHVGHLKDLDFQDGYFDLIYASQVLEHLQNPTETLGEFRRLLRKGGVLYVDVPNYWTLPIIFRRDDFYLNSPPQHINYFTPRPFASMLVSAGFDVQRVWTEGGLKWENLIGRPIKSEIAEAYSNVPKATSAGSPSQSCRLASQSNGSRIKALLKKYLVNPLFYYKMQVGMLLCGVCHRP